MAAKPVLPSVPRSGRRRWGRAQLDAPQDPYKAIKKPDEPTVCPQCGAVYRDGRWNWSERPTGAHEVLCQACHRINDHYPAGVITFTGAFVAQHKDEMLRLARHQEEIEKKEHPANRIIDIEEGPEQLVINTTDIHLPRRIVEAQKRTWRGKSEYHYDEHGYFVRANWHRDT
ncbi:MAG TPA: BCAM0308 family protein [Stellaceae bacterium]|nr:BCAM0308 family protein [Stellaceae bacterium]